MLKIAYVLARIGADTAENERIFAKICQKLATTQQMSDSPLEPAGTPLTSLGPRRPTRAAGSPASPGSEATPNLRLASPNSFLSSLMNVLASSYVSSDYL